MRLSKIGKASGGGAPSFRDGGAPPVRVRLRGMQERLGPLGGGFWLLVAFAIFFNAVERHYAFEEWLFLRHLHAWSLAALFLLACLVGGRAVLALVEGTPARVSERLLLAFALGVLTFATGVLVAGLLGLLGAPFFFAWPLALIGFGARASARTARRILSHTRRFGVRLLLPRSALEILAFLLLAVSCLGLYLQVLTPANVGGDAHGYHLPIAEHYVAAGKIRPFAEGWFLGAYPQLASLLYTWAFLAPGSLSSHLALAAQIEWILFLATLAGLAPLVRRLVGVRAPFAGAAVFLFPGIFLYDSNLIITADHVLAFWTVPLALSLLALSRRFGSREGVMAGLMLAGGLLTKHQGSYLALGAALVLVVLTVRARRWQPAVALGLAALLATSSHWLKNWVFYGNPVYPFAGSVFASRPLHDGASDLFRSAIGPFPVVGGALEDLPRALVTFSFVRDGVLEGSVAPVFGSLFTLLLPLLLLLRAPGRLWLLAGVVHVCLGLWWLTFPADRFLQILLPLMAACTASLLWLAWCSSALLRAPLAALVLLQLVWGGDTYFSREHRWIGDNPLKRFVDHVALGHVGRHRERDVPPGALVEIGKRLPEGSKLLVHDLVGGQLGAGSELVNDARGWQGGLSYLELDTPEATRAAWERLGVTHTVWHADRSALPLAVLASEVVYRRAVLGYGIDWGTVAGRRYFELTAVPRDAHLAAEPTRIAWLGCGLVVPSGIYTTRGLVARQPEVSLEGVRARHELRESLAKVNAVIARDGCDEAASLAEVASELNATGRAHELVLWIRVRDALSR